MIPVIILGSGNSGSGAIKDYLCARDDIFDPLGGQEFRLIQEKGGLSCLHRCLASEFHPDRASYGIIDFIELANRLGKSSKKFSIPPKLGYGFEDRIPNYQNSIKSFIKDITVCLFKLITLKDLLDFSTINWVKYMSGYHPKFDNYLKPIPVTQEVFFERSKKLFDDLFFKNPFYPKDKSAYVFDQAGSFWSPSSSTKYFGEKRKIIVVSRDPRDIYAQHFYLRKSNVSDFVKYYNGVMSHLSSEELFSPYVLHINFNNFALDFDNEFIRLCKFLNISCGVNSKYNPKLSIKNIGVYKDFLTPKESDFIINHCVKVGDK